MLVCACVIFVCQKLRTGATSLSFQSPLVTCFINCETSSFRFTIISFSSRERRLMWFMVVSKFLLSRSGFSTLSPVSFPSVFAVCDAISIIIWLSLIPAISASCLDLLSANVGDASWPHRSSSPKRPIPDANFFPSMEILMSLLDVAAAKAPSDISRIPEFSASSLYADSAFLRVFSEGTAKLIGHCSGTILAPAPSPKPLYPRKKNHCTTFEHFLDCYPEVQWFLTICPLTNLRGCIIFTNVQSEMKCNISV